MSILNSISTASVHGGTAKSGTVQFVEAALVFSGRTVRIIDADAANGGYIEATRDNSCVKLRKFSREESVRDFVRDAAAADCDLIVDTGAGALSGDAQSINLLRDIYDELRCTDYRHVTIFPINSNKSISEATTNRLIQTHRSFGDVVIAKADLSGSGNFPAWLTQTVHPLIDVPIIAPGFVDLRMRSQTTLSSWLLSNEEPDQLNAKAAFANAITQFVSAPCLTHLINAQSLRRLADLGARVQPRWTFTPETAAEAVDKVLQQVAERADAIRDLKIAAKRDPLHPYYPILVFDQAVEAAIRAAADAYPATFGRTTLATQS